MDYVDTILDGFDFNIDFQKPNENEEPKAHLVTDAKVLTRRMYGRAKCEELLPRHLEPGCSYHVFTFGKIDSKDFLNHIIRDQKCEYVSMSTWSISRAFTEELKDYLDRGDIARFDIIVSDYFSKMHGGREFKECAEIIKGTGCRLAANLNHSKVIAVFGDRYDAVIETSANANQNPRNEHTCVTVDSGLAMFYKEIHDDMKIFEAKSIVPDGWKPYTITR